MIRSDRWSRTFGIGVILSAVILWGAWLYQQYTATMSRDRFGVLFLGGLLVVFAFEAARRSLADGARIEAAVAAAAAVAATVVTAYVHVRYDTLLWDAPVQGFATTDYVFAAVLVVTVAYLAWRAVGPIVPAVLLAAIGYAVLGEWAPGLLGHGGIEITDVLHALVLGFGGIYGWTWFLEPSFVAPLVLYVALQAGFGGFGVLRSLAARVGMHVRSGFAGTLVAVSAVSGSIAGSYVVNARLSGESTVPALETSGLSDRTAAGIEAAASAVGQTLPPIVAFSMLLFADMNGESYLTVALAGAVPALVLLASLLAGVHLVSRRTGVDTSHRAVDIPGEPPTGAETLGVVVRVLLPLSIYGYVWLQNGGPDPDAGLWLVASTILVGLAVTALLGIGGGRTASEPDERPGGVGAAVRDAITSVGDGLSRGAVLYATVVIAAAALTGVVELVVQTGLVGRFGSSLADAGLLGLAAGPVVLLVVGAVLGAGPPTLVAVGIVGYFFGPAMLGPGIELEAIAIAYMTLYAVVAAGLVPRRGTAVAETANVAGVETRAVSATAASLVAPVFVLPFAFVAHPELVATSPDLGTLRAGLLALIGALTIVYGLNVDLEAPRFRRRTVRAALSAVGVLVMVVPSVPIQGVAALLAVAIAGWTRRALA